jgi:hypothetical protein
VTITILCAGALALPGGSEDSARSALLTGYAPREEGATARLLARRRAPRISHDDSLVPRELPDETWLRRLFAVDDKDPIAAFALHAGSAPTAPDGLVNLDETSLIDSPHLLVRPVHLHVGLDHVVLAVPRANEIELDESRALADTANTLFAEDGLQWSPDTATAWTLRATSEAGRARLDAFAQLQCRSARLVDGRNIDAWQPIGEAARAWRALLNELQMLWHEHPVNLARERAGRPVLNSAWLEGRAGSARLRAFESVITSDDAVAGIALSAGSEVSALPSQASADDFARLVAIQEQSGTVLLDPGWWREAVARGDARLWQQAWQHLDTLLERLGAAGQAIGAIVLTGERDLLEFAPHADDRWALWRRRRLADLLALYR